jgi:hypothetical protein
MMAISMEGGGQRIQISRIVGFRAFNPVAVSRFMVFHSIEDNTEGAIVLENDWIRCGFSTVDRILLDGRESQNTFYQRRRQI